jgi:hypothetical protein
MLKLLLRNAFSGAAINDTTLAATVIAVSRIFSSQMLLGGVSILKAQSPAGGLSCQKC